MRTFLDKDVWVDDHPGVPWAVLYFLSIYLLNIVTEQVLEAYSGEGVRGVCHGEEGTVLVSLDECNKVIELDCSTSRFTYTHTIYTGLLYLCHDLCYIPSHDSVVFSGQKSGEDPAEIWAMSCRDGSVVWKMQGEVEGKKIDPHGLLWYEGVVMVVDADNHRILVLDASDGSCIKTIQPPGVGRIWHLGLCNTRIVMIHGNYNELKISFFEMS